MRVSTGRREIVGFRRYTQPRRDAKVILKSFGYELEPCLLRLPRADGDFDWVPQMQRDPVSLIPRLMWEKESARRQFFIAPLLLRLILMRGVHLTRSYRIEAGKKLTGTLDYLAEGQADLIVTTARDDLHGGFRRLAAQLVAVERCTEPETRRIYGAISTGDVWRFACLDRVTKTVWQDINLFRVPADLEDLARVMVGILDGQGSESSNE